MQRLHKNIDAVKKEITCYLIEPLDIPHGTCNILGITSCSKYIIVGWELPRQEAIELVKKLNSELKD